MPQPDIYMLLLLIKTYKSCPYGHFTDEEAESGKRNSPTQAMQLASGFRSMSHWPYRVFSTPLLLGALDRLRGASSGPAEELLARG